MKSICSIYEPVMFLYGRRLKETAAAGRKTDEKNDRFEDELIESIASSRSAMASCFARADKYFLIGAGRSNQPGWDALDTMRAHDGQIHNGIAILKAIAEVTLAAAKLRGEFKHNYDVTRRTETANGGEGVAES